MSEERIILPDSVDAARFQKVEGWVSREGRFYGSDEQAARWGGATHIECRKCGRPTPRSWTVCKKCREEQAAINYLQYPVVRWTEDIPIYSQVTGRYYQNREEVRDDNPGGIFDPVLLQLVLCKPIYASKIDPEVYYEDLLPEYDDLSDVSQDLVDIFQSFNDLLTDDPIILSYEPTRIAVI